MVLDEFVLTGQVALVAGAGGESGRAIADALAEAGADIVAVAGPGADLDRVASAVLGRGRRALALAGAMDSPAGVERAVEQAIASFGKIDILVNNPQVRFARPLLETSVEDWRRVLDATLTTTFLFCKAVGGHMAARRQGKVVNIASGMGDRGLPNSTAFSASQAGIMQLTSALAVEWGPLGIKVNAAGPVWFEPDVEGVGPEASEEALVHYIPMRRRGRWEELARMVLFLACDGCHFLTGKTVFLDGGVLSHA